MTLCRYPSILVTVALAPLSISALTSSLLGESWDIMKLDLSATPSSFLLAMMGCLMVESMDVMKVHPKER